MTPNSWWHSLPALGPFLSVVQYQRFTPQENPDREVVVPVMHRIVYYIMVYGWILAACAVGFGLKLGVEVAQDVRMNTLAIVRNEERDAARAQKIQELCDESKELKRESQEIKRLMERRR